MGKKNIIRGGNEFNIAGETQALSEKTAGFSRQMGCSCTEEINMLVFSVNNIEFRRQEIRKATEDKDIEKGLYGMQGSGFAMLINS